MDQHEIPASIRYWYARAERAWVIETLNSAGYQIGEALYIGSGKADAMAEVAALEAQHGVKAHKG